LLIAAGFLWAPVQADAYIYAANDSPSGIARAELSGTGLNDSFLGASKPAGVAVDSQHIYWANTTTNSIGRANLDGTNVDQTFLQFTSGIGLGGVAVDSGHIYWTEANGGSTGDGDIGRANLDGTSPTTSFVNGLNDPAGVAVTSSRIYWSDFAPGGGSIGDATLNGSSATNSFATSGSGAVSGPLGLAVDGSFVYWANFSDGSIGRIGLSGSGPAKPVHELDRSARERVWDGRLRRPARGVRGNARYARRNRPGRFGLVQDRLDATDRDVRKGAGIRARRRRSERQGRRDRP
jgi:hypothetical protein